MALSETANLLVKISAENQTARALADVRRGLDGLASTATKVAGVIASALAFINVIDSTRRLGDEIDLLRDNLGLTAKQASLLNFQARAVGTTAEEVSASFGALNRKLIDQIPLLVKGESDFDKWGVTVRDASGDILPFDQVLGNVSRRLRELPAGFARSGLAMDLMGRSGRQLIDLLTLSDQQIGELNAEAEELGLVLSEAGVDSIEAFNWQMNRMGLAFDAIKLRLGMTLLPLLRAFAEGIRTAAGAVKALAEALRTPLGFLKEIADRMASFAQAIRKEGFGPAIVKLAEDIIAEVGKILGKVGTWVSENLPKWIEATKKLFDGTIDWIRTTGWPSLVTFIETKVPEFANWIVKSLPEWTKNAGELISNFVRWWTGTGLPLILEGFGTATSKIGMWLLDAIGWMSHVGIPAAHDTLLAIGGAILNGIVQGLGDLKTKIWNWIKEAMPLAGDIEAFIRSRLPGGTPTTPATPGSSGGSGAGPGGGAGGGVGGGGGRVWAPGSPLATLDDIYANYESKYGVMPTIERARELLAKGLTYGQVSQGIGLAGGGIVRARPGGTLARIGEGGRDEAVIPLSRPGVLGGSGLTVNGGIHIHGNVDSRERVDEVVEGVASRILDLAGSMGPLRYR